MTVHDVGVHEGQVYIVSDYLGGTDLVLWLQNHRPSWHEAARIAAAVADALAHAHAQLVIHRDVKPANIVLTADRMPVLVDFGLALDEVRAGGGEKGAPAERNRGPEGETGHETGKNQRRRPDRITEGKAAQPQPERFKN